ncbi:MAG: TetR/AcrR family transcriptional regulator [Tissierellia bacterium]|nr:TetR/AcrR family transcriptional regulator [Tissierellia bacterium]
MDRRVEKTRVAIFNAFQNLLMKKSYPKITVQDIIDDANIGRSTFYAHFETKDALLYALCTDMFQHIFSRDLEEEETHDFSLLEGEPIPMMTHILYHLKDNKKLLPGILKGEGANLFWDYFSIYFQEFIQDYLLTNLSSEIKDLPLDFIQQQITGSFIELIKWWLQREMNDSPEKIILYYQKINTFFQMENSNKK